MGDTHKVFGMGLTPAKVLGPFTSIEGSAVGKWDGAEWQEFGNIWSSHSTVYDQEFYII